MEKKKLKYNELLVIFFFYLYSLGTPSRVRVFLIDCAICLSPKMTLISPLSNELQKLKCTIINDYYKIVIFSTVIGQDGISFFSLSLNTSVHSFFVRYISRARPTRQINAADTRASSIFKC